MKVHKKIYLISGSLLVLLSAFVFCYFRYASPTRIATLNFPDFTVEKFIRSNNNPFVSIESVSLEEADQIKNYDMVLVRVHGNAMNQNHLVAIEKAIKSGVPVFSTESNNSSINTLHGRELEYIATLIENGSVRNYQSLFNYIRKRIDKKLISNKAFFEPLEVPQDYYFHLGDDNFFARFEDYQRFYEKSGKYKKGAPRVVLLSGNINLQNSNEEHFAKMIQSLERKGLNLYPINSFGKEKLSMIAAVKPNLIISRPHGRLVMGGGESGVELLKQLNVPILAPITVNDLYDHWLDDDHAMASGSMLSMNVVLPELDGAIAPFAVAAQFERKGMRLFDAIPSHTEKFCSMVKNYTQLQIQPNAQKKIAIYYFKGIGKGAVHAADLEGVESLYNLLQTLRSNGYTVNGLPSSADELEKMIQKQGAVLAPYALGAYDQWIRNGDPELIPVQTFNKWTESQLPKRLIHELTDQHGEAPGKYMCHSRGQDKYIAVARIQFGNVVILPQPLPAEGDELDKIIHGVKGAPTYPYVASYLWAKNGFKADALVHFGTHGSLEFIPGKQIALSDYDWSDVLVADLPHFYIYTINNIGEGIIAKRRTYSTLISHLTAPFMEGGLYDEWKKLSFHLNKVETLEKGAIRQEHWLTVKDLCSKLNIFSTLGIDSVDGLKEENIQKIHQYMEQIKGAKVTDGLYTWGKPYSKENIVQTTRLISLDRIRYALAQIDKAHGKIKDWQLDDLPFIDRKYSALADRLIHKALNGEDAQALFHSVVSSSDRQLLAAYEESESKRDSQMAALIRNSTKITVQKSDRFLDQQGYVIPSTITSAKQKTELSAPSMMDRMAQAQPQSETLLEESNHPHGLIASLVGLKDAISNVKWMKEQLAVSTLCEEKAILNALAGGYIAPSSAGDPIINPQAIPTGHNFYAINPETTPTAEAWKVGKRLADHLIEQELSVKGEYPQKVSFTLWSTDFISTEGATIAQILWLLGVEPLRDGFGHIRSLRLVEADKLGRPRIDVVVQTSGQLRDIAASRLELIHKAVSMAAEDRSSAENYVRKGFNDAEKLLLSKGFSPAEARKFSKERIFGGVGGNYGTGIMGLVEKGDSWDSTDQIASQYIKNMGAIYSGNGPSQWGETREGVFQAALLNTSVVVQPRSSNTWGPLSLDHVYEFMGGLSVAVKQVTGNDPSAYFNDFRNTGRAKVQGLKEAIGVESSSTVLNPKYIAQKLKGEASSVGSIAETIRNTFGWNVMKPSVIDQHIWNQYHAVYIQDTYQLGVENLFAKKNPYALQELTAVMLESARKGMWKASAEQIRTTAQLHARMVVAHQAGCSGFICDNLKLQEYISEHLSPSAAQMYKGDIKTVRQIPIPEEQNKSSIVLQKEETDERESQEMRHHEESSKGYLFYYLLALFILALIGWAAYRRKKR